MTSIKIYGAGSIGNHLAHAARVLGWDVAVGDVSDAALERMKTSLYPSRYGSWDPAIRLFNTRSIPPGGFDVIHLGTPPEHHIPLALQVLKEEPRALLIEKPLCPPSMEQADLLYQTARSGKTSVFVGYDHVVGKAATLTAGRVTSGELGTVETLDVEFREHWEGIFKAHPWLRGPSDSYLGYWKRGGGASGEHSHAVNLWQHFAHAARAGKVTEVGGLVQYRSEGEACFDSLCLLDLRTESGLAGRVVQDIVTRPARKRARIQGTKAAAEWVNGYSSEGDAVVLARPDGTEDRTLIPKRRPDDFIEELRHVESRIAGPTPDSPIALERGLDTMLVVAAAHLSEREKCRVSIDYSKGYTLEALRPCRA